MRVDDRRVVHLPRGPGKGDGMSVPRVGGYFRNGMRVRLEGDQVL